MNTLYKFSLVNKENHLGMHRFFFKAFFCFSGCMILDAYIDELDKVNKLDMFYLSYLRFCYVVLEVL